MSGVDSSVRAVLQRCSGIMLVSKYMNGYSSDNRILGADDEIRHLRLLAFFGKSTLLTELVTLANVM